MVLGEICNDGKHQKTKIIREIDSPFDSNVDATTRHFTKKCKLIQATTKQFRFIFFGGGGDFPKKKKRKNQ